jgi:subtilisin-like proprotein convertase family protein
MPRLADRHSVARRLPVAVVFVLGSMVIGGVHSQETTGDHQKAALATDTGIVPPGDPTPTAVATFSSGNLSLPISDLTATTSTLSAAGLLEAVQDVNVSLRLNHTFDNDLRITLTSPSGVSIPFVAYVGGNGDNFGAGSTDCSGTHASFDDEASLFVAAASAPFAGTFRPIRPLGALDGSLAAGTWTLTVTDEATGDSGVLYCWTLTIVAQRTRGDLVPNDSRSDFNIWRPSIGTWFTRTISSPSTMAAVIGQDGDIPLLDRFATGVNRRGVFRPSTGTWIIEGLPQVTWGISGDVPVPADYGGDGVADIAVWRPSAGVWFVRDLGTLTWGTAGDIPVPARYLHGFLASVAVWRPSNGAWFIAGLSAPVTFGSPGDIPVPADYFGDEREELAVFRPSEGVWYILGWDGETRAYLFGSNGDIPVPADYNGDGKADVAVWRPSDRRWYVRNVTLAEFGTTGDIPGTKRPSYPGYPY